MKERRRSRRYNIAVEVEYDVGDGFDITVNDAANGNLSRVEVKRDGRYVWDMECAQARFIQQYYGRVPQQNWYVVDFTMDSWPDGALRTAGANIEFFGHFTATDSLTIYASLIDEPENNTN